MSQSQLKWNSLPNDTLAADSRLQTEITYLIAPSDGRFKVYLLGDGGCDALGTWATEGAAKAACEDRETTKSNPLGPLWRAIFDLQDKVENLQAELGTTETVDEYTQNE